MYRKEVNERSPMRVFEGSMHGGLGRGNVGVVVSRPGVGKTALLVQIALDDLLRDRRVLHVSHEHTVEHVRAYYDEMFNELVASMKLEEPGLVRLEVERSRLIYSHLGHVSAHASASPGSAQEGRLWVDKILQTVSFARGTAHFEPDVIIIDGFDVAIASEEAVEALAGLARERSVEIWIAAQIADAIVPGKLPAPLEKVARHLGVVVYLQAERDIVRLRLLKDHDNHDLADFHLRLDPHSMCVIDEEAR